MRSTFKELPHSIKRLVKISFVKNKSRSTKYNILWNHFFFFFGLVFCA